MQELYEQVQHEHARAARPPRLDGITGLTERLRVFFETGLETIGSYRRVAPGFLSAMVSPDSPINPLSVESSPARELTVGLLREAVRGAAHRVPDDIAERLPDALFPRVSGPHPALDVRRVPPRAGEDRAPARHGPQALRRRPAVPAGSRRARRDPRPARPDRGRAAISGATVSSPPRTPEKPMAFTRAEFGGGNWPAAHCRAGYRS